MFFYSFEYPGEEVCQGSFSIEKRISLKHLDKDFFCKSDDDNYKVCICSRANLDLSREYSPYFLSMNGRFRKEALEVKTSLTLFDKNKWNDVFDFYVDYLDALENTFNGVPVALNLSFGDYCILIPSTVTVLELEAFKKKVTAFGNEQESIWDNAKLSNRKSKILDRFSSQHVYKYLPCYDLSKTLILELLRSDADTEDRGMECIVFAGNLLSWFLDELNVYLFNKNGEVRSLESDLIEDINTPTHILINSFLKFLSQIGTENLYCDQIWSFLFITKALLFTVLGPQDTSNELSVFKRYDFSGFVPIVTETVDTMDSSFPDLFAPQRTFAFLQVPVSFNFEFWRQFPAFIHEFFHYVPTNNRQKRNAVIIKLTLQTIINELANKLSFLYDYNNKQKYDLVEPLCESYKSISYLNTFGKENRLLSEDSMFFLGKNIELFSLFDFESAYEALPNALNMSDKECEIHSELENECIERWERFSKSHLQTYTMAFREIRADMAMCILLDLSLMEYVEIMALEPTWSTYSADQTADSSIIRFGFITRYLFLKTQQKKGVSFGGAEQFNSSYRAEMESICLSLKRANPNIVKNIDNILGYVKEYFDIMIESESGYYTEQYHSEFECVIYPPLQMLPVEEANTSDRRPPIIQEWEENFEEYRSYKLFNDVKQIYRKYHDYLDEGKYEEAVKLNYQSRLVLRDLFSYCEAIHELGKTE